MHNKSIFIALSLALCLATVFAMSSCLFDAFHFQKYTVIWKNEDGTILETDTEVEYGSTSSYDGALPLKAADAQYSYTFSGWSPEVGVVTEDTVYTANYSSIVNKYTVIWKNEDGTILETDTEVEYGSTPSYDGALPLKAADAQNEYEFDGWTSDITGVSGDTVFIAKYKNHPYYVITFDLDGGNSPSYIESATMTKINKSFFFFDVQRNGYDFVGWECDGILLFDEEGNVVNNYELTGNKTVNAKYESWEELSDFVFISTPSSITITGVKNKSATELAIPDCVTGIGDKAFSDCTELKAVTIPSSVTSIGSRAFQNCVSLTDIVIPDSVVSIGKSVFYNCNELTEITLSANITSIETFSFYKCNSLERISIPEGVRSIGQYAFSMCTSLASVIIPNSVTTIESGAFLSCHSLTSVIIPNGVTEIESSLFSDCISLASVIIPNSVTKIGLGAFHSCRSLTSVIIPDSVTILEIDVFHGCENLTNVVLPAEIKTISNMLFVDCKKLTNIVIPDSVTTISPAAFLNCCSLSGINIPDGVTSIGLNAFSNCISLTNIRIPQSVVSIGKDAFFGCVSLVEVYNKSDVMIVKGSTENGYIGYYAKSVYSEDENSKVFIENGFVTYRNDSDVILLKYIGNETALVVPDNVTEINAYALSHIDRLTSLSIPKSVKIIGKSIFNNPILPHDVYELSSITYAGKTSEWETIIKQSDWNSVSNINSIVCENGTINL